MSACVPADRLKQTLITQVPGVTEDMLNLQVFNVLDEFFRRTNGWRTNDEIELVEDHTEYPYAVPAGAVMVRAWGVSHNGLPVPSASLGGVTQNSFGRLPPEMTFADGDATFKPVQSDLSASGLFTYSLFAPDYIAISVPPTDEQRKFPLVVSLVLSVGKSCLECDCGDWSVPDWAWDSYFQAWLDGCLGKFYGMPSKPWASPTHAQYHQRRFRNAMAYHKQEAVRGMSYNVPTWRFPRVGGWTR